MSKEISLETEYLALCRYILENGNQKGDRTGTGTLSVFGPQIRGNLADGFPLLTTKKMFTKGIIHELLWFLSGSTNIKYLQDNGVHIWDSWTIDDKGNLGPVYGHSWRDFGGNEWLGHKRDGIDQIKNVIQRIKDKPNDRRLIVSAWNPAEVDLVKLPPCHTLFQFYVFDGKLSCQLYQRSMDCFLGAPFNIASYALLTHMIAQVTNLQVGEFIHTVGDAHIYLNHVDQMKEQISRIPMDMPKLWLNPDIKNIDDFKFEDIRIEGYQSHPAIRGEVSV